MSGHSKWSTIKRKKAENDQKKNSMFTKLIKNITSAVKTGGSPDPEANFKLKLAIDKARASSMPLSNIESAIKKASGQGADSAEMVEITYEGYAPGGVAIIVQALTDNRNRTAAEIRHTFSKYNGNLGESGCVGWMFEQKGSAYVPATPHQFEALTLKLMDLPIDDVSEDSDGLQITMAVSNFETVKKQLVEQKINFEDAEITMLPKNTVKVENEDIARQILTLIDALEDNEDVQDVFANFDIPEEILDKLE
ncbi:MAG TPA: YebC/PmpR family DNA-binding transcriptional regulator [bacterium]|nr:YebC/PmpR family DNA-binding transcriptional regulator [bacterium]